ncbi:MAG: protein kinase [Deltaproteobacteria bacterium]|nr:MAG: protein kinase [Deltaproteobacteria bacterium]
MTGARKVVTDTSDFFSIDSGDELVIGERRYEILGHAKELRFGIEDPKFWVKRAIDLDTGERKIIKLAYFESFDITVGGVKIRCFRDPAKEGKVLELVRGNRLFMQGEVFYDEKENNIRVLDIVHGPSFMDYIGSLYMPYDVYYREHLPGILKKLLKSFDAIHMLHTKGFRHGDIRNDHLIVDRESGNFVWIDFDYDFEATENRFGLDVFGIGNIICYAVGKGFHTYYMIKNDRFTYGDLIDRVTPDDFSLLDQGRLINLAKLYPQIPEMLNSILMFFSTGATVYYETVDEVIEDLRWFLDNLPPV